MTDDELFHRATVHHKAGQLHEAEGLYRMLTAKNPEHAEALHLLALALIQHGKQIEAVPPMERSVQLRPSRYDFHNNLGELYRQLDRLTGAEAEFRRAIALHPPFAEAHYNLANLLKQLGRHPEAIAEYETALRFRPNYDRAHYNLANTLREEGRAAAAVAAYRQALELRPDWRDCWLNCANALFDLRDLDAAVAAYRKAQEYSPDDPDLDDSMGNALFAQGKIEECAAAYRRALAKRPRWPRELRTETLAPPVAPSAAFIDEYRSRLARTLDDFLARNATADPADLHTSGAEPPMALTYQGRDDLPIKRKYAELFTRALPTPSGPPVGAGGRDGLPKVGVVVTNGHEGVYARCLGELVARLDPAKLDVRVVCSRSGANVLRHMMPDARVNYQIIPDRVNEAAELLRSSGYDLLYYWEIGTDSLNYFLPYFLPARVQATGWGWPSTSGLPAIDDYVSADALEPPDADAHYSEQLTRLPVLPTYYVRPPVPVSPKGKSAHGFDASTNLYMCQQNVRKFHPDFDALLGAILRLDPAGVVALIADDQPTITEQAVSRLRSNLGPLADRIRVMPRQDRAAYLDLVSSADVILDTPHYGGGANTVYDAIAAAVPIVTWPGHFHRGRWAAAALTTIGVTDTIASTLDKYAETAVGVAKSPDYRAALVKRIRESSDQLFHDDRAVREYEKFFVERVRRSK